MKILIALFCLCSVAVTHPCFGAPCLPKDEVRTEGQWQLVTVVLHQGATNQTVIGKLEFSGKEIVGEKDHCLTTPFGRYVWRGDYGNRPLSGWITLDSDMDIKEVIPAEIDPSTSRNELHTKKIQANQAQEDTARKLADPQR